jgi:L-alanine-DL-glutamate epimerase-like enolase superfamily enzyme
MTLGFSTVPVDRVSVAVYTIPTDFPEADGTIEWDHTTIVIVTIGAGGQRGLGYTYASEEAASLVRDVFEKTILGTDALSPPAVYEAMWRRIRNLGRAGLCSTAISAVDCALWDLKARLLDVPLLTLLGQVRGSAPVYGSGGFTSYSDQQLAKQFAGWVEQGIRAVKMKIGRDAQRDLERVGVARTAIGTAPELYVDANGAYTRKQALVQAERFSPMGVTWFEEPVSSDDVAGLRLLRDRAPAGMDIAAGEYGYEIFYFERMLSAGAVDVLQADITRCGGVTSFLQVAALCQAHNVQLSAHTAPAIHAHVACAVPLFKNIEYFHDHVRIERMLFDGAPALANGELRPDPSRPGNGLVLKHADAEKFAA